MKKRTAKAYQQATNAQITTGRTRERIWQVTGVAERDMPRFDRERAMAEARRHVNGDPLVKALVQTSVDSIVSTGFRLVPKTGDNGFDQELTEWWVETRDTLDIRGIRTFGGMQRAWQTRKMVDGDVGIYHNFINQKGEHFVQTIEADRIRSEKFDYLDQGCEFDKYGRPVRWHIGPRPKDQQDIAAQMKKGTPVSADDFCLLAHWPGERVDQLRGTSMLLTMFNSAQDVREIIGAMLQKVKASAFLAWLVKTNPSPTGTVFGPAEKIKTGEDGVDRRHRRLVPMSMADLGQGEDITEMESRNPAPEFERFLRFIIRYMGTVVGMPLEFCLYDMSDVNFSSGRMLMELCKRRWRCEQMDLMRPSSAVYRSALQHAIDSGAVIPPRAMMKRGKDKTILPVIFRHRWGTPAWPQVNPQAEVAAAGDAVAYGFQTITGQLADTSDMSLEELVAERKKEVDLFKEAGVDVKVGNGGTVAPMADATKPVSPGKVQKPAKGEATDE